MNRLLLLIAFCATAFCASAQYNPYWEWAVADTGHAMQSNNGRHVLAVKGGKALWGHLISTKSTINSLAYGDYLLQQLDTTGAVNISTLLRGSIRLLDAHADGAGNWYVLGAYHDSLLLPNGQLKIRAAIGTDPDHFMIRFDAATLAVSWYQVLGSSSDAVANSFTIVNNQIYIPIDSSSSTIVRSMNIVTGIANTLFVQNGRSNTSSIAVEPSGSIMLAGSCGLQGINFNGTMQPPVNGNSNPAYLVRYSPTGIYRWHYWLPEITCVDRKVTVGPGGIIYYTGPSHIGFTFGTQTVHGPAWANDYIAARLDTSGNVAWVRQVDTTGGGNASLDMPYHAVVTPDSSLTFVPLTHNYLYWRDTVTTDATPYYNAAIVSFGKDSHTRWARLEKGDLTTNQQIAADGDAVWVTGNAFSSLPYALFDTLHLAIPPQAYTPFIAKLQLTPKPIVPNAVTDIQNDFDLHISPNPAIITLQISFRELAGSATLKIYDLSGKALLEQTLATGDRAAKMQVGNLARGIYLLEIKTTSASRTEKVILQ